MDEIKKKKLTQEIRLWIDNTDGWFTYKELDGELNVGTPEGKTLRRVICHNLAKDGIIERDAKTDGKFRRITDSAPFIEWQNADIGNIVPILWPFKLETLVVTYPKNVMVIGGSYNAGKTAMLLDFIRLNMHRLELASLMPIVYFNSEMGPEEMKLRISKFGESDWPFEARERSDHFADVIRPDRINVIDYLEITTDFWLVAEEIKQIWTKLKKGICVIALQKKTGEDIPRGGEGGLEKARLYCSIDSGKFKIIKAKNWAQPDQNPNGLRFSFKLIDGSRFVNIQNLGREGG